MYILEFLMYKINWLNFWRLILIIFLLGLALQITRGQQIFWLHGVDLFFHEAGHTFFAFSNETINFLGGTIFQLVAPIILALYFLFTYRIYSASIMLWWLGENLTDIGLYISDARSQALPLLGNGQHDWFYLLNQWGWLLYDTKIGSAVWFIGIFTMYASLVLAILTTFLKNKNET